MFDNIRALSKEPGCNAVKALAQCFYISCRIANLNMSYIFIKQSDTKIFKAFMSGHEIEVGVVISDKSDIFGTGEEIEIFYGEHSDTYKAKVTRQKKSEKKIDNEQSFVTLGLRKR
jgi:hypothetical protein